MKLRFLTSSGTTGAHCPSIYETDTGQIVVQGQKLTDSEALTELRDVLPGETFVVVPRELMDWFVTGK